VGFRFGIKQIEVHRMKYLLNSLIFILLSISAAAQCPDSDKLTSNEGFRCNYDFCDSISIEYYNSAMDISEDSCSANGVLEYFNSLAIKAEKYIKQRAGTKFYNRLITADRIIIDHDFYIIAGTERSRFYKLNSANLSYCLTYSFMQDSTILYVFGLEFDSEGKRVSKPMIPDISKNPNFMNIVVPCKTIEVVKKQKLVHFTSIRSIELSYDNNINSFIWLIKENSPNEDGTYKLHDLMINANTGKLYKTQEVILKVSTVFE
jgi:hypothetical protein